MAPIGGVRSGILSGGGVAIPDTEDFEHNDLTGVYGGDTGLFDIQQSTVNSGDYALEAQDNNNSFANIVRNADPWDRSGFEISYDMQIGSSNSQGSFVVATDVSGFDGFSGYAFYVDPESGGDKARLRRYDSGSLGTEVGDASSLTTGDWIRPSVSFSDGDVTWSIDGATITLTDNNYTNLLIGFQGYAGSIYYDDIQFSEI